MTTDNNALPLPPPDDPEIDPLCAALVKRAYEAASEAASALDDINARWGIAPMQHEVDAVMARIQHPNDEPQS